MTNCSCNKHTDNSGFPSGILLGLVLGAAGVHFLNTTDDGKKILSKLKESASNTLKDLGDSPVLSEKLSELQKTMDVARSTINNAAEKLAVATETKTPPKKNFFQKLGASLGK